MVGFRFPSAARLLPCIDQAVQTRTKVLNDELDDAFRRWYPRFRPQPTVPERNAA